MAAAKRIRLSPSGPFIRTDELPFKLADPDQAFAGPVAVPVGPAVPLFGAGLSIDFPDEITQALVWFTAERSNAAPLGSGLYVLTVDGAPAGGSGRSVDGTPRTEAVISILVGNLAGATRTFNVETTALVGVETVSACNLVVQPYGLVSV